MGRLKIIMTSPSNPPTAPPAQKIACVIPAYNEEKFIAGVVGGIPDFIDRIIVVNDASSDRTGEVVAGLGNPRVMLINHTVNQGVGGAMISGYRKALEAGVDIVVKLDGDGQMDPANLRRLIAPILRGQADYAKGVRFRDADVLRDMPTVRLVGNLGLSFLTKVASGYWNIFDPTNGYTALGRAALKQLHFERLSRDYFFETSMLINLYRIGAVVADVPMKARYGQEQSKLSPAKVLVVFPFYLLKALLKRILWRYFIQDFTACSAFLGLGLLLTAFGVLFGLSKWWMYSFVKGTGAPIGTVMVAVIPLILGFQLLLQALVLDISNAPQTPIQQLYREDESDETQVAYRTRHD